MFIQLLKKRKLIKITTRTIKYNEIESIPFT